MPPASFTDDMKPYPFSTHPPTPGPATAPAPAPRPARSALDAFGHASLALRAADGRILWQTPLARQVLQRHFGLRVPMQGPAHAPAPLRDWVAACTDGDGPWTWHAAGGALACTLHPAGGDGDWLVVLTEARPAGEPVAFTDLYDHGIAG